MMRACHRSLLLLQLATTLIGSNLLRVGALNRIGHASVLLGKLIVCTLTSLIAWLLLQDVRALALIVRFCIETDRRVRERAGVVATAAAARDLGVLVRRRSCVHDGASSCPCFFLLALLQVATGACQWAMLLQCTSVHTLGHVDGRRRMVVTD